MYTLASYQNEPHIRVENRGSVSFPTDQPQNREVDRMLSNGLMRFGLEYVASGPTRAANLATLVLQFQMAA